MGGWVAGSTEKRRRDISCCTIIMDKMLSRQGSTMANGKQKLFKANAVSSIKT